MSDPLPARTDLEQLRRRAKELRDGVRRGDPSALERFARHHATGPASLAAAQLVIARELGFASWPRLKAAVDAHDEVGAVLKAALVDGRVGAAASHELARRNVHVAAVLGDVAAVRELLAAHPEAALAIDEERGWPPLLYACYSQVHRGDPARARGLADVARVLLDAGASPNTNDGGRQVYRSALRGAVEADNPDVTEVLLEAGADPDPGQPIGEAVAHRDTRCLRLLLAHGARVARTWAMGGAVFYDNAAAVQLLLGALGSAAAEQATEALPEAAAQASLPVVAALLDAGADPDAAHDDGISALRHAVRAGKDDVAELLRARGASADDSAVDRFLGACLSDDLAGAARLFAGDPGLAARLTEHDRAAIVDAAGTHRGETVAFMLEHGFRGDARNELGEQPLHVAAYHGNAAAVEVLLAAGADVDARDDRFDATPLAYATVGSGERAGEPGDWLATVRLLLDAGAARDGVWVATKPPSKEVAQLLRRLGVGPHADETPPPPVWSDPGSGVLAEVAEQLADAYRERDIELLAALLHPDVQWTGRCQNRAEVLDWYRGLLAEDVVPTVLAVHVEQDAVILELSVAAPAEGARPAPPQRVAQVFTVVDAQIVDIRGR